MPNAYTWQFTALDVYPTQQGLTNVVFQVHWRLTGDDGGGHTATAYGTQLLGPPDPGNFIPFASLTASVVQGWVEARMGTTELNAVKADLSTNIDNQVSPATVQMAPPWGT